MEFYDWLLSQGKSPKTARNYSGPMSGRLSTHAKLIGVSGFDHNELLSDQLFESYCRKNDQTGELYDLNRRGKDMYRRALVMYSEYLRASQETTANIFEIFEKKVSEAKKDSQENRKIRLKKASGKPAKTTVIVNVYDRNPDVVVEVLYRANGNCEHCKKTAPFIRKSDNTPYLEVHHKTPLTKGGDDTVENAEALCPNCHREMHFGKNNIEKTETLYNNVKRLIKE